MNSATLVPSWGWLRPLPVTLTMISVWRTALPTGIYDVLETLAPGTWYNIWVLVNNTSDTYEVWMNSDPGGDAQASDQMANDAAETLFGFRTATGNDLINFFIKTGGGNSPVDGRFYIDDIYLEDTDDINLNNPVSAVPIPAAAWLFGSGLLGLIGIARRRKSA